jgi:predicted  nucleic acid-binding Zn-ribbon protein
MEKPERLNRELEQLEGRLEFSKIQEFALQESLRSEKERAARTREGRRAAGRARRAAS